METDFVVIGGGIAGASVAAELAAVAQVTLLEREVHPGVHSTGRSAALFSAIYGNAAIRALSRASRAFLTCRPTGFSEVALVKPRGSLFIATAAQVERLDAYASQPDVAAVTRRLSSAQAVRLVPALRTGALSAALFEPGSMDIEVHELHQGYLRQLKRNGGTMLTDSEVTAIARDGSGWRIKVGSREFRAAVVINAAGAWADEVARMAGTMPVGLQPYRRTVVLVDPPAETRIDHWPLVIDIDESFYVKPDAGLLLVSPADETPVAPGDAQAEELDIAVAIHRAEEAMTIGVRRTRRSWAGLRTFVADRTPVVGFDPAAAGFFWLAGQGGYGIQTAPALARMAAALATGRPIPDDLAAEGVVAADLAPDRIPGR